MYKREDGETVDQLIYRITRDKEQIGTWQDVADILNELLGTDYNESTFRKKKQSFDSMMTGHISGDEDLVEELRRERIELEKAKVKYRDERNEYNRVIRQEARKESYEDLIKRTISEHARIVLPQWEPPQVPDCGNDLIVHFTDVHAGIVTDNFFNKYDMSVLGYRIAKYLSKIIEIGELHKSQKVYVILSEVISGLIHENLRCDNNQNVIEQFLNVSDYITQFLETLSRYFAEVHVYVCPGNHSRVNPKKEQNMKGENFDHLLIPYIGAKLQNFDNICFHENNIEESVCMFNVRGNIVMGSHGDKDSTKSVVEKFSMLFHVIPDLVYMGHRHRNGLTTVYNTKIIESGSVSGVDNYALNLRVNTAPEQTVSVVGEGGLICLYDVQLM